MHLEGMARKEYFTFSKAPRPEPPYVVGLVLYPEHLLEMEVLPLCRDAVPDQTM